MDAKSNVLSRLREALQRARDATAGVLEAYTLAEAAAHGGAEPASSPAEALR